MTLSDKIENVLEQYYEIAMYEGKPDSPEQIKAWRKLDSELLSEVQELEQINAALEAEVARNPWISVGERLPENSIDVLITAKYREHEIAFFSDGEWYSCGDGFQATEKVTHWQPLLAPPEQTP